MSRNCWCPKDLQRTTEPVDNARTVAGHLDDPKARLIFQAVGKMLSHNRARNPRCIGSRALERGASPDNLPILHSPCASAQNSIRLRNAGLCLASDRFER